MKQGVLAIYDRDTGYACRLMEYLNQKMDFLLEARVFTNLLSLKEYLERNAVELLLLGEEIALEELSGEKLPHIMILTEHGMVRETGEYPFLYKFQSMESLVREVALCYSNPMQRFVPMELAEAAKLKQLIGVFSPFGGSGKTLFSLAMGQELSNTKKTLYIGMEAVSSFEEEQNIRGNLSDILYWIKERKEGCLSGLALMTERKGKLDCIYSPDYYEDLNHLKKEDIEFLLKELYANQTYETIIFDIGFWNEEVFFFLEQMDAVYMPDFLNRKFLKKENELLNSMRLTGNEEIYHKIKRITLPFDEEIFQGEYDLDKLGKTKMGRYVCKVIRKDFP